MKKTVRIITTVAAMALTIAIMSVGIFAATKLSIGSTSSLSFTASKDVSATVTISKQMKGATATSVAIPNVTNGEFKPSYQQGQDVTGSVELGDITFTKLDDTFTLTLTVTNTFANATSKVDAKYTVTCANTDNYYTIGTTSSTDNNSTTAPYTSGSTVTIEKDQTLTLVTTIEIATGNNNEDTILENGIEAQNFSFSLELTKTSTTPSS